MKILPALAVSFALLAPAFAEAPNFLRKDDRIVLQAVTPLPGNATEVRVVEAGLGGSWVQVEYDAPLRQPDGTAGTEKVRIWVNFDHVISVKRFEKK